MNRLSKGILAGVLAAVGLVVVLAFAFRAALKSDAARERIQSSLSGALGMNVRFEKLSPTFFKGTKVTGLMASREGGSCFLAREIYARPRLLSLLKGEFVLSEVRIEDAKLVWVDSQKGSAAAAVREAAVRLPVLQLPKSDNSQSVIRRFQVRGSSFEWIDSDGKRRAMLDGIRLQITGLGTEGCSGALSVSRGSILDLLYFTDLSALIAHSENGYRITPIRCASGGGVVEAEIGLSPGGFGTQMDLQSNLQNVDLQKISEELPSVHSTGILQGRMNLRGQLHQPETFQGEGEFSLENGMLKGFNILQMIGQIFQVHELANLRVSKASTAFRIEDRKFLVSELSIRGGDIALSAPGEIDFDQRLNLRAKLALPEKMLEGRILQAFSDRFAKSDDSGMRAIEFQVSGTMDKPKTNLLEKLVGGNLGNVIDKVLGGFLKPKKERPKPEPEQPAADPASPK